MSDSGGGELGLSEDVGCLFSIHFQAPHLLLT